MRKLSYVFYLVLVASLFSCMNQTSFKNEIDFRNYIRDKHPYSVLKDVDFKNIDFSYQVNDTIKNEIWIYLYETKYQGDENLFISHRCH